MFQEVYDTVKKHLLTQNKKSLVGGQCRYRGEDGTKCALGVLIPDEDYDPDFELRSLLNPNNFAILFKKIDTSAPKMQRLMIDLRTVHDIYNPTRWPEALSKVAERYRLND